MNTEIKPIIILSYIVFGLILVAIIATIVFHRMGYMVTVMIIDRAMTVVILGSVIAIGIYSNWQFREKY